MTAGSEDARAQQLQRWLDRGARFGLLAVGGVSLLLPGWVAHPAVQWAPWGIALLCFGLAHGGIDHRLPWEKTMVVRERSRRSMVLFQLAYLGGMGATLLLWWASASLGWVFFLALSVYHFGQGDLYWSRRFGLLSQVELDINTSGWGSRLYGGGYLLLRGALPVLLPLLLFPDDFRVITREIGAEAGQGALIDWRFTTGGGLSAEAIRTGVAGMLVWQWGGALWLVLRHRRRAGFARVARESIVEAGETLLLLWLVSLAPPILSIGTYFLCWHSPRHVARLVEIMPGLRQRLVGGGTPVRALMAYHREAAPMTLAAAALFLLLWGASLLGEITPSQLVAPAIVFISAITVPHVLIVSRLDRFQRVWGTSGVWSAARGGG